MIEHQPKRVLLIDQDEAFGAALRSVLGEGYALADVSNAAAALPILERDEADVVLLNWDDLASRNGKPKNGKTNGKPATNGTQPHLGLLELASELAVPPPVIVFSWDTRRETAVQAIQQGAHDFFPQPLSIQELRFAIDRAFHRARLSRELAVAQQLLGAKPVDGLLGNSKPMEHVRELIHKVAGVFTTILITGESGTGKEVVARAIHRTGPRAQKPFVAFSACALPESLIEDELFGHEKGAFTGAAQSRRGRFEEAQGGTIFLDEIGDLALPLQAKLLRVLQERSMERLGSNAAIPLDVRVVCATNRDLEKMVDEGLFRQDLYFRVSVVKLRLPPLRERVDDIPLLAEHFLRLFASAHGKGLSGLSTSYVTALTGYEWPGNVRELQNVIERSVVLADGNRLGLDDLPPELSRLAVSTEIPKGSFHEAVQSFKREIVRSALRLHGGNKVKAARELSISRCYLHRLLNQLNITEETDDEEVLELADPLVVCDRVQ